MKRFMIWIFAAMLLAGVPVVALADDAGQDTMTNVVEVAVEGDDTIDESSSEAASPSSESPSSESSAASSESASPVSESAPAFSGSTSSSNGMKSAPSSTSSTQKAPSTGDRLMGFVIPGIVAATAALAMLAVAFAKIRAGRKE